MKKDFTKDDLKKGMCVKFRNSVVAVLSYVYNSREFINYKTGAWESTLSNANYDYLLNHIGGIAPILYKKGANPYDIMEVYSDYTMKEILWKRPKEVILSQAEKTILANVNPKYKYIARDEDGLLGAYVTKPVRCTQSSWKNMPGSWVTSLDIHSLYPGQSVGLQAHRHLFKDITWEDEPYLISDLLKG
jgi:hypothetical protein